MPTLLTPARRTRSAAAARLTAVLAASPRSVRRSDREENWFQALRRAASSDRSHREMGLWLALCDELRSRDPESPQLLTLLSTMSSGRVPILEGGALADRTPELPAAISATRGRELVEELIDRLEHHRSEIREILPVGVDRRATGDPTASPSIVSLAEPTIVVAKDLPPHWSEIDLTTSLREFEERVREERIMLEELRLRAIELEAQSLMLDPVSPERARRTLGDAIEKFNRGDLDDALFELEQAESELRRAFAEPSHRRAVLLVAQGRVDPGRLEALTASSSVHPRLRRFLRHFPEWSVQPLIDRLTVEGERKERRRLLDLLLVHGWDTRRAASSLLLEEALAERPILPWYVTRNLLFLLRRLVERDADASEIELMSVLDFADFGQPHQVVTEAIGYLSRVPDERSEGRLIQMLELLGRVGRRGGDEELRLERSVVEHLLRMPSGRARAHAVQFLTQRGAADGYHLRLLESLAADDLGRFPEVVATLQQTLERQPRGWRRWLRMPRSNAALERTIRQVLATAVSA